MTLLRDCRLVLPERVIERGWLSVEGSRIVGLGEGDPPIGDSSLEEAWLEGATVVPGFVDLHVHGGGGRRFEEAEAGAAEGALGLHLACGTTTQLASLGAGRPDSMLMATAALAGLVHGGSLAGVHLEGPFLSPLRRGAQDPTALRAPDAALLAELLSAGEGTVRAMTVAPELPGGLEMVEAIRAAGVIPAIGHTDASFSVAKDSIRAGVRLATHLFNGMRPLHHRDPGAALAAVLDGEVVVELVNDGHHLADGVAQMAQRLAGARRTAFVTDAMAAAGVGDGTYRFGHQEVRVEAGRAMLADGSSLAGSCLTMDRALRRAVKTLGFSLVDAALAASTVPARLLGIDKDRGSLSPGLRGDLAVLNADLDVVAVMRAGQWVSGQPPGPPALPPLGSSKGRCEEVPGSPVGQVVVP